VGSLEDEGGEIHGSGNTSPTLRVVFTIILLFSILLNICFVWSCQILYTVRDQKQW